MTTQEKIAVLTAFEEGKQIEFRFGPFGEWQNSAGPVWNFGSCDYRVKPELPQPPKKTWQGTVAGTGYKTTDYYATLQELVNIGRSGSDSLFVKLELVDAR